MPPHVPGRLAWPTTTIFPSSWSVNSLASSAVDPLRSVTILPSVLKLVSSAISEGGTSSRASNEKTPLEGRRWRPCTSLSCGGLGRPHRRA